MGDVVGMFPQPENLRCACGSEWWSLRTADGKPGGLVVDAATGSITGRYGRLTCRDCGEETTACVFPPLSFPPLPELSTQIRPIREDRP